VTVLAGSAVAGQALRDIHPQRWLVAAVYRDDSLIVPHGDTVLEEGDRVLLVGSPEVLDGVGDFIRGGRPVFPGQYGARLGVVGDDKVLEEAEALRGPLSVEAVDRVDLDALRPDQSTDAQVRNHLATLHLGLLLLPPSPVPYLARIGLQRSTRKRLLLAARLPVLVARGSAPYRRVLVAGDSDADLEHLARVAVDVARLCGAQLRVLTVTPPALAVGADDLASHEAVPRRMAHLARLHGVEAEVTIDRGNPIERIRHHAREADLLVIGISPKRRSTIFDPDVSLHLLHDCPCSTLFVPSNRAGR
jgi:nucleotide-binding universal stress UspA family protein